MSALWTDKFALSWLCYMGLLILRFSCAALPGYIHPDEFFQGGQELFFGCGPSTNDDGLSRTWEFQPEHAIRSISPPTFMTLVPLWTYTKARRLLGHVLESRPTREETATYVGTPNASPEGHWMEDLVGWEIWILPRFFLAALSIVAVDFPLWFVSGVVQMNRSNFNANRNKAHIWTMFWGDVPVGVLLLASSWPSLLFLNRPFSNTLETMSLAILLATIVYDLHFMQSKNSAMISLIVGVICSVGVFVRFTFVFFATPAVLIFLYERSKSYQTQETPKDDVDGPTESYVISVANVFRATFHVSFGFIAASSLFIGADTAFYSTGVPAGVSAPIGNQSMWGLYVTPLNALLYNSKTGNLSEHGLHPRFTHVVVNMFLLYGPTAAIFYESTWRKCFRAVKKILGNLQEDAQPGSNGQEWNTSTLVVKMCHWVIFFGLSILSCAPHQEPRFLLPILFPLMIVSAENQWLWKLKSPVVCFWIMFNMLLVLFFGGLHQSGVVPSLLHSHSFTLTPESKTKNTALYFHTYMPPTFLARSAVGSTGDETISKECPSNQEELGRRSMQTCHRNDFPKKRERCGYMDIFDLKGSDYKVLLENIHQSLGCEENADKERKEHENVSVVAPASVIDCGTLERMYRCERVWSYHPHVSTEDFPPYKGNLTTYWKELEISVIKVRCK